MDNAADPVLQQLRKLREGAGLTTARLERSGALMSALGTADPEVAVQRLTEVIAALDDTERVRAVKVDLGLDFEALVGRVAVSREREWLGERRSAYAETIGRDVKTLARWSDRLLLSYAGTCWPIPSPGTCL